MGGGSGTSPCASCKLLRRRCAKDCIFAPYFPPDDPHKFAIVHKVFGASNVSKMLQELPLHQRGDAVSSLVFEANARMRDPVYGCVGAISYLQNQVTQLQTQLAVAQTEILCFQMQQQQQQLQQQQQQLQQQQQQLQQQDHHHHYHLNANMPFATTPQLIANSNEKSVLLSSNNLDNVLPQFLSFGSSSIVNVTQDPLKRESLWA